ncbi:unnamed protein product [Ilex paraguariensis]|uniref:Uncharacterized protein n=1 Tax=Ilex paraguariensis TaxID=185542 RepID=A0ABC8QVW8_9AQUA
MGLAETTLAVAARSAKSNNFVKNLVDKMSPADLALPNYYGTTALHTAAATGNIEAAKLLVNKNIHLPYIFDYAKALPLHVAANRSQREMVLYLMEVTEADKEPKPFEDETGVTLVVGLIAGGLYDITLDLVRRNPKLAWGISSPLQTFASKQSAFRSGARLNYWQQLIYSDATEGIERLNPVK